MSGLAAAAVINVISQENSLVRASCPTPPGAPDPMYEKFTRAGYQCMFPANESISLESSTLKSWYLVIPGQPKRVHRIDATRVRINTEPTSIFIDGFQVFVVPLTQYAVPFTNTQAQQYFNARLLREKDSCRGRSFFAFEIEGGTTHLAIVSNAKSFIYAVFCGYFHPKPLSYELFVNERGVHDKEHLHTYLRAGLFGITMLSILIFIPLVLYMYLLLLVIFCVLIYSCAARGYVERHIVIPCGDGYFEATYPDPETTDLDALSKEIDTVMTNYSNNLNLYNNNANNNHHNHTDGQVNVVVENQPLLTRTNDQYYLNTPTGYSPPTKTDQM